jgi:hypothetical protein
MFKLARTFNDVDQGANSQRGFPAPGTGAQITGDPSQPRQSVTIPTPIRPTKGKRSFFNVVFGANAQRGMPEAQNPAQAYPDGLMYNHIVTDGNPDVVITPYYSRGAAAAVQNFGKVTVNPIGAGIFAEFRPQASYGVSSEYHNGQIWWTPQNIPTSIPTQSLTSVEDLSAALGPVLSQAAIRQRGN